MTNVLLFGSKCDEVLELTQRLKNAGIDVIITDEFTSNVQSAVIQFQRTYNLVADGIVGQKTMAALNGKNNYKFLSEDNLIEAAEYLRCELAAIKAVNAVESRGHGFHQNGDPVVLFERHIMRRRMLANGIDESTVGIAEHQWPDLVSRKSGGYKGGLAENQRLNLACEIHQQSALESASWGQFQIMGYHWKSLGYASISSFAASMSRDERSQLSAFVGFIEKDPALHNALKTKNWQQFALIYNGKAYAKNNYDQKLQAAYTAAMELKHA